jgi:hypothetical protein
VPPSIKHAKKFLTRDVSSYFKPHFKEKGAFARPNPLEIERQPKQQERGKSKIGQHRGSFRGNKTYPRDVVKKYFHGENFFDSPGLNAALPGEMPAHAHSRRGYGVLHDSLAGCFIAAHRRMSKDRSKTK